MDRNECPESNGTGVRIALEWVSGMPRNTQYCLFGIFHIGRKTFVKDLTADERSRCAHGRRVGAENDLVIWADNSSSGRFEKAIPIGFYRKGAYRVREDLLDFWEGLKVKEGYIHRSVRPPHFEKADKFLDWLDLVLKGRKLLHDNG